MVDSRTAHVTYTEAIVRDAVRTFVWRRGLAGQKLLWTVEAAMTASLIWMIWRGEGGWVFGVVCLAVLLPPCLIAAVWVAHHRNTVGKFRRMSTGRAEFAFHAEGFDVASELGSGSIPWSTVTEIWERPAYWMIFTAPNQFLTLPLEPVSPADRDFLRSKAAISRKS
jgi:hypothetical protein